MKAASRLYTTLASHASASVAAVGRVHARQANKRGLHFQKDHVPRKHTLSQKIVSLVGIMVVPVALGVYGYHHVVPVPLTGRRRVMWLPPEVDSVIGDMVFDNLREEAETVQEETGETIILGPDHPAHKLVMKVRSIMTHIEMYDTLQRVLALDLPTVTTPHTTYYCQRAHMQLFCECVVPAWRDMFFHDALWDLTGIGHVGVQYDVTRTFVGGVHRVTSVILTIISLCL